ncbi:hypothetical protein JCM8547_002838 [Rhodosporidiobolus lusitaniae]
MSPEAPSAPSVGASASATPFSAAVDSPRSPASWSTLPSELRQKIVGLYVELDQRSSEQLLVFVQDILPSVSSFIKNLRWDHVSIIEADGKDLSTSTVKAAEKAAGLSSGFLSNLSKPSEARRLRVLGLLVGEVIKQCTALKQVELMALHPEFFGLDEKFLDHAFEALIEHAAPSLRTIEFILGWNSRIAMQRLPRLLERATELEGVQIGVLARMPSCLRSSSALAHVQLNALDIPSPLAVAAFLRPFSNTLESLSLGYVQGKGQAVLSFDLSALLNPTPSYDFSPLSFPSLAQLAIVDAPAHYPIFTPSSPSPETAAIKMLALENPTVRQLDPLIALLEAHKRTLKAVQMKVSNPHNPTAGYFEVFAELSEWCDAHDVDLDLDRGDEEFKEGEEDEEAEWTDEEDEDEDWEDEVDDE